MDQKTTTSQAEDRFNSRSAGRESLRKQMRDPTPTQNPFTWDSPARAMERAKLIGVELQPETMMPDMNSPAIKEDPFKRLAVERILGLNNLQPASFLPRGTKLSRAIGRIRILNGNVEMGFATGFLISPNLLLTNNHVLESKEQARDCELEMNYEEDADDKSIAPSAFRLDPDGVFITSERLDYTVVAVNPTNQFGKQLAEFGWVQPYRDTGKVLLGENVNIIQHPGGDPKKIAIRDNKIIDFLPDFIHYQTDTARGSSGSAMFSDQWLLVGIHHAGVPKRDVDGRVLRTDGTIWREADGDDSIEWIANEGVRISSVIKHIESNYQDQRDKHLVEEMLQKSSLSSVFDPSGENPMPKDRQNKDKVISVQRTGQSSVEQQRMPKDQSQVSVQPQPQQPMPPIDSLSRHSQFQQQQVSYQSFPCNSFEQTFVIPLQITVSLGQIQVGQTTQTGWNNQQRYTPVSREAEAAINEFLEARNRPYYDQSQDERDSSSYYANVDFNEDSDRLVANLSQLLTRTHRNQLGYSPARNLYPWVDVHPDMTIKSVYTQDTYDVVDMINEGFAMEERVRARMEQIESMPTSRTMKDLELGYLEDSIGYNCEHSVPQSWFSKASPMKGDLHHLFACESQANGFRSNYPYYDFDDYDNANQSREVVKQGWGKLEQQLGFEPYLGKGPVARGTLYFLLRYPEKISARNYDVDMLLEWHRQYSPTLWEKHRNAAIFAKQGNRNPFIDYPSEMANLDASALSPATARRR